MFPYWGPTNQKDIQRGRVILILHTNLLGTKDRILIGQNILITGILIAGFYCI